jgi:hypothetical protein
METSKTATSKPPLSPEILEFFRQMGKKGGPLGGAARRNLSFKKRQEIALRAAQTRRLNRQTNPTELELSRRRRNALIVRLYAQGALVVDIAEQVGIGKFAVYAVLRKRKEVAAE